MKEWQDFISRADIFSGLTNKEKQQLLESARQKDLKRNDALFNASSPAESLCLIMRGSLKTMQGNSSHPKLLVDFMKKGDILGEESVLLSGEYDFDAIPFDSASVLCLPAENVKKILAAQPRLGNALAALAASRAREYRERLYLMSSAPVPERMALALFMLARRFGKKDKRGTMIDLRLTHQDLADYVGASRETVSMFLSGFRKKGLVAMNVRKFIIPDVKALKKYK